jgi:hypothetical protein
MDQQKLRSLVFEKTGVKIDVDDPIFALVALNEAVLAEAVERHVALLDAATGELAAQVDALHEGGSLARPAVAAERPVPAVLKASAPAGAALGLQEKRALVLAAGAAIFGALLVLFGQALLFKPAPAPVPVIQARELTTEQSAALAQAEKLNKAILKLDAKARNALQAEMQKP